MLLRSLALIMLLATSAASMGAQLWTLEGDCLGGDVCGSAIPQVSVRFNIYLDDAALVPTSNPADLLAFQTILDPGGLFKTETISYGATLMSFTPMPNRDFFFQGPDSFFQMGSPCSQPCSWQAEDAQGLAYTGDTVNDWVFQGTVDVPGVPLPAAVWLFGSGLIGLLSIARRKKP